MTSELLGLTIESVRPLDGPAIEQARELQARLTKPAGSLGALEELSERLAGLAGSCPPPLLEPAELAIFAGDHGVHAQGVTPWPQVVTAQMVGNFLAGGAAVNALARQTGVGVTVVDVGVATDVPPAKGLISAKVRAGTRDMTVEPALTRAETTAALEVGIQIAHQLIDGGARILLTGDMGIANTTASAALIAAFTGREPGLVTGYGTGIDAPTHLRKVEVIGKALSLHGHLWQNDPARDPIAVLGAVGGLEHAALAGYILGAASRRVPVILDGVIAAAAALAAAALAPDSRDAMIAGHRSVEPGADVALTRLELAPLLDLGLRLGEGTGAVLAYPVVASAVRVLHEMATFDSIDIAPAP
ncbi:nicotinate-nucleotide--dimethylbenzimidazole phosphoribosyltransferase [Catellatospora tritici]|uniref:nicotinate-nucleotide--dimethylbenzimidazole phosphoribosyltransferase n=1 Tax=Catellatospora tritici TaxID=2851566 RepID=UPI001C2D44B7|nr:nicotinate-nucleotide--dimethylbenzimidazole phosphoribosyltransferase [Catellatospora tritici]MBV1854152.1 nicotinate-nucleotide--dimethylbenzimidazole phosphoribosyltransferase [Catellatospora tritici]